MSRVKKLTKKSEQVATGILSGVVKVSGFFTSSIVNSKAGKKFFSLLPGEIVLASLDGFSKFVLNIAWFCFAYNHVTNMAFHSLLLYENITMYAVSWSEVDSFENVFSPFLLYLYPLNCR